jgi:phosphatidylglycerol:prolipoprotein diacylglycerol transferase
MRQVIWQFHVGDWTIPIYGYGLMLVIGFLLAAHWAKHLARRAGLDGEVLINAAMVALVAGIVGARLSHILENLDEFARGDRSAWDNFVNMVNLTSGGLTYYGGFSAGTAAVVGYLLWKKLPLRKSADLIAPGLMVALGIGRVGCFLNGCCYGAEADVPWAVRFPYYSPPYVDQYAVREVTPDPRLEKDTNGRRQLREPVELERDAVLKAVAAGERSRALHPAQLYSTVTALLIAGVVFGYYTLPHAPGRAFALMMVLEGGTRFLLEMLRAEQAVIGTWSLSMVIGAGVLGAGVALWVVFAKMAGGTTDSAR